MIGSSAVAAWIAHVAFWVLIVWGLATDEVQQKTAGIFLVLWIGGFIGLPFVPLGASLFSSYVAVLDVILVFLIFKGDVRIA